MVIRQWRQYEVVSYTLRYHAESSEPIITVKYWYRDGYRGTKFRPSAEAAT